LQIGIRLQAIKHNEMQLPLQKMAIQSHYHYLAATQPSTRHRECKDLGFSLESRARVLARYHPATEES
jgi:hypothetical protein